MAGVVGVLGALTAINLTANLADLAHREWVIPLSVLALVAVVKARGMRWSELGMSLRHMPRASPTAPPRRSPWPPWSRRAA
ncbi:hypothetical protein ACFSSF_05670 [Dietzia aerolata]|uniref:hypothetical protein n=1 Tax=Dietzia aerolata TaxID=595984 RepID=UPI00363C191E